MPDRYECDKCGACCRFLIIEIIELDLIRESRLIGKAEAFRMPPGHVLLDDDDNEVAEEVPGYGAGAMLACGCTHPCPMLVGNDCSIYPTRPTCCVGFRAGSEQCQDARAWEGLEPLKPVAIDKEGR